ncbi:MAG TPA: hypothetical protein VG994_09670 [Steroidobacteraceae bacterium]|jgi:hypothetical protein|nr:hypothetical protein [Steroidobacteraceae bacterium]
MKALYSLAVLAALAAGSAHAACSYPKAPDNIPDGNTATLEQMIAAQKAVKQFDQEISAYTACLKLENDNALAQVDQSENDPKKKEEQKKELERVQIQKHNAAVEEDEALAQRFNEQLKVFKAKAAKK